MFVLFEEKNQVGESEHYFPMHIEGKDKGDCKQKVITHMDSMYGGSCSEGEGIDRKYDLSDRDVSVDNVKYFETKEELVEALLKRTEVT